MEIDPSNVKDFIPYLIGLATTLLALKKDWIGSKLGVKNSQEDLETKSLGNIHKEMSIYKELLDDIRIRHSEVVDDMRAEIKTLQQEIIELRAFNKEQKDFIAKQSKSLAYYTQKFGKIIE